MFDQPIKNVMQRRKILKAPPDALVSKAARLMARKNVGAVMVVESERLVGIFTERDIAFRVVACGLDPQKTRLADVMTPAPDTVGPEQLFGYALLRMHEGGFRHMPVLRDSKVVGIVSARSAMDPELEEFVSEAQRRKYYLQRSDRPARILP
jgi:CBS domain-containing protein